MDLESVRMLLKVAELASFTRAAEQLGLPKSRVSLGVQALERELGTRLLQRTTRTVRPTIEGEQFLVRARRLLLEADEVSSMFQQKGTLRGRVRLDLPVTLARNAIIPRLPELLAQHPQLELLVSTTDRLVEVVREGFDCVLRIGTVSDPGLTARRLGAFEMGNYASPAYLQKYGTPHRLEDLDDHYVVHYSTTLGGDAPSFEYRDGATVRERPMKCLVTVNGVEAFQAACVAGLGIIQGPRYGHRSMVEHGLVVEVLPELRCEPMPVSIIHAHGRNVPKRVRAVMNWLEQVVAPLLS